MERDPNDLLQTCPVEGEISYVDFSSGRGDGLTNFQLASKAAPDGLGQRFSLWGIPGPHGHWGPGKLTVDGKAVTYPELMAWLCTHAARVVAHVNTNSYGSAVAADFFTVAQEGRE